MHGDWLRLRSIVSFFAIEKLPIGGFSRSCVKIARELEIVRDVSTCTNRYGEGRCARRSVLGGRMTLVDGHYDLCRQ